ncbi:diaminobutyrate--2-oxoglutarate transaminase family protein [Pseudomonas purpurea]|uniref:diaminobutyrate--2-oxoglutarate transaminase family protein n=1 Tax=Pseudomonas purpurea TaxID=3136737 RepID=UPI0032679330
MEDLAIPISNAHYLERQSRFESNARSYPHKFPIAIKSAQGAWVTDVEGRQYLDCLSGAGTLALGHNHSAVIGAIRDVLDHQLPLHTLDLTTPIKDAFCETVLKLLPGSPDDWRLQFCGSTGADAVEAALKLAKIATGRSGIISFCGAYHGMTHGALSVTGNLGPKTSVGGLMPGVQFLPYPYSYRCPLGIGGEAAVIALGVLVERFLDDVESGVTKPAAIIVEAIQGEGGVIPAPVPWLVKLREVTRRHGIILILDEVQAGIGRTGQWFAFEHAKIVPDMIVLSKAIGGGLPLSLVAYQAGYDVWPPGAHAGTFRGNQLAMATGQATLDIMAKTGVLDNARSVGAALEHRLMHLQRRFPCMGDIRGRGLMLGIEIVDTELSPDSLGSHPAHPRLSQALQRACFDNQLIAERGGRNGAVLRLLPPLTLTHQEGDIVIERLEAALETATSAVHEATVHA